MELLVLGLEAVALVGFAVVITSQGYRLRKLEDKIDHTRCILLHPEREGAWCPEAKRNNIQEVLPEVVVERGTE